MYENIHIKEPKWKSWIIQTTTPIFTPEQCRQIIDKLVWVNLGAAQIQRKELLQ